MKMNVLFITSSRIGDAVLSTGILDYIVRTHPEAGITVVCGPLVVSLFEGLPNLTQIIPLKKQSWNRHWFKLWQRAFGQKWDMVVDLRNSVVSRLIRARVKYFYGPHINRTIHKVEQNASVMSLDHVPSPRLWFTDEQKAAAEQIISVQSSVLAVGPTANWKAKTWPAERFCEVVKHLIDASGEMPDAHVAVFCAPGEEDQAKRVLDSVPENRRIDVMGRVDPGTAAAILSRCSLYLGNDSGLMHCAAAVGVPTLGLFGPGYPDIYGPWGKNAHYASTPESCKALTGYDGYEPGTAPCLMETLSVEEVIKSIPKLDR